MKIIIAGGGIGGLTAALCLQHFGHDVSVYEQTPVITETGAGIQIPPNAMKVLIALGLGDELLKRGVTPLAIEARMGPSGKQLFRATLEDPYHPAWGAPYVHIHRADYVEVLAQALESRAPGALQLGRRITGYRQDADNIWGLLDKAEESPRADILVGADGIHSRVRAQMLGDIPAKFTGNVAWRAIVPLSVLGENAPQQTACVWMGEGRHAVTYRLRGGQQANFVGVVERENWTEEGWTQRGDKADALADFTGWHPTITTLLQKADPDTFYRWALFDRPPLSHWIDERAVLLGDAAHPMLPFMAQGAAMATEDAWALGMSLERQNVPAALTAYQDKRLPRTSRVQAASRANMKTFHKRSAAQKLLTYGPMWLAGRLAPWAVHKRLDWLYKYDVTNSD